MACERELLRRIMRGSLDLKRRKRRKQKAGGLGEGMQSCGGDIVKGIICWTTCTLQG